MKGSKVIQFRLHPSKEDEAAALKVYDAWVKKELTAREIGTKALLALGNYEVTVVEPEPMQAIRAMLIAFQAQMVDALSDLLDARIEDLAAMTPAQRRSTVRAVANGSSSFASGIRNAVDMADYEDDD